MVSPQARHSRCTPKTAWPAVPQNWWFSEWQRAKVWPRSPWRGFASAWPARFWWANEKQTHSSERNIMCQVGLGLQVSAFMGQHVQMPGLAVKRNHSGPLLNLQDRSDYIRLKKCHVARTKQTKIGKRWCCGVSALTFDLSKGVIFKIRLQWTSSVLSRHWGFCNDSLERTLTENTRTDCCYWNSSTVWCFAKLPHSCVLCKV